jgi:endonuclease/exonuclease/phosphatase family metal-dependent hydrolase
MVRLVTADTPDVVCLQELPLWSLPELDRWSGMRSYADAAAPARFGPFPSTPAIGRAVTAIHSGWLRSSFTGQGNAILVGPALRVLEHRSLVLNDRAFRRQQARWLGLGPLARFVWSKERRIIQTLRLAAGERTLTLANLHATSYPPDERIADAEVFRAAVFADGVAQPSESLVIAGDLNVRTGRSQTLADLTTPEWGFAHFGHGVDHVLVRGAELGRTATWPAARRTIDGVLLSDHAPIEAEIA